MGNPVDGAEATPGDGDGEVDGDGPAAGEAVSGGRGAAPGL